MLTFLKGSLQPFSVGLEGLFYGKKIFDNLALEIQVGRNVTVREKRGTKRIMGQVNQSYEIFHTMIKNPITK